MNCRNICFGEPLRDGAPRDHAGHAESRTLVPSVLLDFLPSVGQPEARCRKEEVVAAREALTRLPGLSEERVKCLRERIHNGYYLRHFVANEVAASLLPSLTLPLD